MVFKHYAFLSSGLIEILRHLLLKLAVQIAKVRVEKEIPSVRGRLLLVDDDVHVRTMLQEYLETQGYTGKWPRMAVRLWPNCLRLILI
jgi:hypothetical protein